MTFPLIDRVYEYEGQKVIVWQQSLFRTVYSRILTEGDANTGSTYERHNWWKFALNAKFIKKIETISESY